MQFFESFSVHMHDEKRPGHQIILGPERARHEEFGSQGLELNFSATPSTTFTSALPFSVCFLILEVFWRKRGPRIFAWKWSVFGVSDAPRLRAATFLRIHTIHGVSHAIHGFF